MSTTDTTIDPVTPYATTRPTGRTTDPVPSSRTGSQLAVSWLRVVRSEAIKFRSVRSNLITFGAAAAALVLLGMLFSSFGEAGGPGEAATDSFSITFGGITLSQLVLGIGAAVLVTAEYSSGLIRTMFGAVRRRSQVLWAKAAVVAVVTWLTMTVASFVTFFVGQPLFSGDMATYDITDPGVLRAVLGAGTYSTAVALLGVALGFIVRSTAAAIGSLVGLLMIAPVLVRLLPGDLADWFAKLLPSGAGDAIMSVTTPDTLLGPWTGLLVLALWVVGLLGAAWYAVERRDA
jgi:ABC-2 type transport system permease protein